MKKHLPRPHAIGSVTHLMDDYYRSLDAKTAVVAAISNRDLDVAIPRCLAGLRQAYADGLLRWTPRLPVMTAAGRAHLRMAGIL